MQTKQVVAAQFESTVSMSVCVSSSYWSNSMAKDPLGCKNATKEQRRANGAAGQQSQYECSQKAKFSKIGQQAGGGVVVACVITCR